MTLTESTVADAVREAMDDPQLHTLLKMDRALRLRKIARYVGYTIGDGHCFLRFETSAGERHVHIGAAGNLAGGITIEELASDAA
jgi:hypothetical protein